ncbi:hypothetical protein MLP_12110 [Microlunatus phosphovorus NM-1]|uniref:Uncharacterized protein n=1 Tax=Microlunatus phosphovorus (strain ATCC 700054 / DSM 10555 / JCM 9379 / NBRC 101784 / NCIMB 13414 / VKM Ac-1990 / NM-1) TaxID=1032480 RepID=F5XNW1_MICPN|nr:hypothetical protein [Microlunatus phosphovorus]BAK34225.1 hypothetical protein MLP_12110 [Microlunatus phosphovorus NM-1]
MIDVLLVILYVAAGIAAAWDARRKGYDDRLFLVLGIILGPILLIIMWFLKPKPLAIGTVVRPAAPITLDDGRRIPPSHVSVVRGTSIIDNTLVCEITAPDQTRHWVAQEALTRVRHGG